MDKKRTDSQENTDILLEHDDIFLKCQNSESAEKWVNYHWDAATPLERLEIVKAYFQIPERDIEKANIQENKDTKENDK